MAIQRKVGMVGETLDGDDELEQSLRLLLVVRKNAVPHRPDIGSELFELLDAPLSVAQAKAPLLVAKAAALEPRLVVDSVTVSSFDIGQLELEVRWHPTNSSASRSTTITVL